MEGLKQWLLSVLAVSLLAGAAQALMPEGPVKKVGQLACGLLLFLAMVSPVLSVRYLELTRLMEEYRLELEELEEESVQVSKDLNHAFIEAETQAYIQTRTEELGISCQVDVSWDYSGETPLPAEAVVTGAISHEQAGTLRQMLTEDLGLTEEKIRWEKGAGV